MRGSTVDLNYLFTQMRWGLSEIDKRIRLGHIAIVRRSGKVRFVFLVD